MTTARLLTDWAVIPWRARGYEVSSDGGIVGAQHLSMTLPGGAGGLAASFAIGCLDIIGGQVDVSRRAADVEAMLSNFEALAVSALSPAMSGEADR